MTNKISAAENPALANDLLTKALKTEAPKVKEPDLISPSDSIVELPGGYVDAAGKVTKTVEVRELTGRDEEAVSKLTTLGKALLLVLNRGTVKVGDQPATETLLDELLIGDRDAILLGILKATFGPKVEIETYCSGCEENKTVEIDVNNDIKLKILTDPVNECVFTVQGKSTEYVVKLPNGKVQKQIVENVDKTPAEISTVILEGSILKIGENPVYSKKQIQALGVSDRKKILKEISDRAPGPQFDDVFVKCPDCEGEVRVPIMLGTLFQF